MARDPEFPITAGRLVCAKCRREQPLHAYPRDATKARGIHSHCRDCRKAQRQRRYLENIESERAGARARMAALPPERKRLAVAQWKARLADGYCRQRLVDGTNLLPHQLPQSLVEAKRLQLAIKRMQKPTELVDKATTLRDELAKVYADLASGRITKAEAAALVRPLGQKVSAARAEIEHCSMVGEQHNTALLAEPEHKL